MFVVYRDAAGTNQIEQCDEARWREIAASADKDIQCVTEIEDVARRAKGVEPKDLGNGIRLSDCIKPDSPPGPENDRYEYLVDHRPPGAKETTILHVWAQGPEDLPREIRLARRAFQQFDSTTPEMGPA